MHHCSAPDCDTTLTADNRAPDAPSYCLSCGRSVWAFRPDRSVPDAWYLVTDDAEPAEGTIVEGDQCDGCGLCEYLVQRDGLHAWVAVCDGMTWDESWMDGCGTRHPVRKRAAWQTIL
jgi:Pyruvate/2-oxoacid:ferredoxin oxidoreductase delta subunit